jgi:DNA-binding MarR family transcriptional regulator
MIKDYLQQAGLNKTEAEIYLTLYEHQRLSPSAITDITGIKRTTIYAAADELVKKGLANITHGKNKRFYTVDSTDSLLRYIELQDKEIQIKKDAVKKAITEMNNIPRSSAIITPKVRVVTENNLSDFLYKQSALWEKSMLETKETTWWGFQDTNFVEHEKYNEWILWYWKRASKKFDLKLLSNNEEIEKEMKKKRISRRKIRFWEGQSPITGTQWVLGNYIISIVTNAKSPYLIQTHDPIMAHNLRGLYRYIWELHEPKKVKKKTK